MASSTRKRTHADFMRDAESDLIIKLADPEAQPLSIDKFALFPVSTCARGLPADATEWDLSHLLIEGQPVSHDVVVAWLDAVHLLMYQEPYHGSEQQQEAPLAASASGLARLLAFADAVGSSKGVLAACLSQLDQLQVSVQAGDQQLQLSLGTVYCCFPNLPSRLYRLTPPKVSVELVHTFESGQHTTQLLQQFAAQLEVLLYLAHKLQLPGLIDVLHNTVRRNSSRLSLLHEASNMATVVSERVLQAAVGPSQHSRMAFINNLRTQPAVFASGLDNSGLIPVGLTQEQKKPIKFKAQLTDDFIAPGSKGQVVEVKLDLFNSSTITIDTFNQPVQLLIGHMLDPDEVAPLLCRSHRSA